MVTRNYWLISLMAFFVLPALSHPAAATETITIVADEWCPYNCAEAAENQGYMLELARAIFKKEGIEVQYKVMPWIDAINETRAGKYTAIVGATYNDAPDFIFPEVLQGISPFRFWVREDSDWRYDGTSSLKDMRIGLVDGVSCGNVMDTYLAEHKDDYGTRIFVTKADDATAQNIEALIAGKFDTMLEDRNVVNYYFISNNKPMPVKSAGSPINIENLKDVYLYIAFGPKHPQAARYAEIMAKGMADLRESGELHRILIKYGIDEFYRYVGPVKTASTPAHSE